MRIVARLRARPPSDSLVALGLLAIAALLTLPFSGNDVRAHYDGLFYEAQKRELLGEDRDQALRDAFSTDLAEVLRRQEERDLAPDQRRVADPEWAEHSSQFYRRRWTVPALAAALDPAFGGRSLEQAALIGWALLPVLLYLLLRRRFGQKLSLATAAFCAVLPPVIDHGQVPVTDSWGLTMLVAGLLLAMLCRDRGLVWLPALFVLTLALSFTRDLTIVLVIAAGWLALRERSRRMGTVATTTLVASLPAPLIFAAPLRDSLAYTFSDFRIPDDTSWGFILGAYPSQLADLIRQDLVYPGVSALPTPITLAMGLVVLAGLYCLLSPWRQRNPFITLIRASAVGGILTILLSPNYTGLRLEMVLVPAIAAGVALLGERLLKYRRSRAAAGDPARA